MDSPEHKKSYIGTAVSGIYDAVTGNKSEETPKDATGLRSQGLLFAGLGEPKSSGLDQEIAQYAGGFLKTATLFMRGKFALPLTLGVYALDEAKPGDALGTQLLDASLGMAKGGAMRGAFSLTAGIDNIAAKGVALGITSRATELGLSRETYRDAATGDYNLGLGLSRVQQGVLSPQALGMDVIAFGASAGMMHGADRMLGGAITRSPFLSTMLTGTTFGITTGGLQELHRQGQTGDIDLGKVAMRAGIQGALDTVAAVPGGLQARSYHNATLLEAMRRDSELRRIELATDSAEATVKRPGEVRSIPGQFELVTGAKLAELTKLLGKPEKTSIVVRTENPNRPSEFKSEQHFMETAVQTEIVDGRKYKYRDTEIAVPESYAKQLERVRRYRTEMGNQPEAQHDALAQRILGKDIDLRYRALPEDFIHAIDLLPQSSIIRRLSLLNVSNPEDIWHQKQLGDSTFRSAAVTSKTGDVTFFKRNADSWMAQDLAHEWGHVVRDNNPQMSALYDTAAGLEKGGYTQRKYADSKPDENWAVHAGEDFLHRDADNFHGLADAAPLRTVAIAEGLRPLIQSSKSPTADIYRERLDFVEREVKPRARQQLVEIMQKGPQGPDYDAAAQLLLHWSTPEQVRATNLTDISLAYTRSDDASVARLGVLKDVLQKVDLTGTDISKRGTKPLYGMPEVTDLSLAHTRTDDSSVWVLPSMPKLRSVDLSNTAISDLSVGSLIRIPSLEVIHVGGTRLTAKGIAELRANHPNGPRLQIFQ